MNDEEIIDDIIQKMAHIRSNRERYRVEMIYISVFINLLQIKVIENFNGIFFDLKNVNSNKLLKLNKFINQCSNNLTIEENLEKIEMKKQKLLQSQFVDKKEVLDTKKNSDFEINKIKEKKNKKINCPYVEDLIRVCRYKFHI